MNERGRHKDGSWLRIPTQAIAARVMAVLVALLLGAPAGAESDGPGPGAAEPGEEDVLTVPGRALPGEPGGAGKGEPGLDDLLKLPTGFVTRDEAKPVAGASEEEWRRRFSRAEKGIADARESLAETRRELDGLAGSGGSSQWSVAPPGASGQNAEGTSPLSFKLGQELLRNREALDGAEKALRELRIEADLAGVPPEWRVVAANPTSPPVKN